METDAAQRLGIPADLMQREARELMTPGVLSIVEDASLRQVMRALTGHRVHALLVVGTAGAPLGWVTAHGLLAWVDKDPAMAVARDAITEPARSVEPSASGREVVAALQQGVSHLLVQRNARELPEGVISDLDLLAVGQG